MIKHSRAFASVAFVVATLPAVGFPPAPAEKKDERIAFTTVIENGKGGKRVVIAVMNPDGSNRTVITAGNRFQEEAVLSPEGRLVAFIDLIPGGEQKTDLFVMKADGSQRTQLTRHATDTYVGGISWSPDGKKIVYGKSFAGNRKKPDSEEIVVIDSDGKNPKIIGKGLMPAWSPDGKRILHTTVSKPDGKEPSLGVMDADGKNPRRITETPATLGVWSPDGSKIAYVGMMDIAKLTGQVYISNADGSDPRPVLKTNGDLLDMGPRWSVDGKRIYFSRWHVKEEQASAGIWVVDADGTNAKSLTPSDRTDVLGGACYFPFERLIDPGLAP